MRKNKENPALTSHFPDIKKQQEEEEEEESRKTGALFHKTLTRLERRDTISGSGELYFFLLAIIFARIDSLDGKLARSLTIRKHQNKTK